MFLSLFEEKKGKKIYIFKLCFHEAEVLKVALDGLRPRSASRKTHFFSMWWWRSWWRSW